MNTQGNEPLPCFRCGKQIGRESFTGGLISGISFTGHGSYGSAVYDSCDPRCHLRIDVCDGCVAERGKQGAVLEATVIRKPAEVSYERWHSWQDDETP